MYYCNYVLCIVCVSPGFPETFKGRRQGVDYKRVVRIYAERVVLMETFCVRALRNVPVGIAFAVVYTDLIKRIFVLFYFYYFCFFFN